MITTVGGYWASTFGFSREGRAGTRVIRIHTRAENTVCTVASSASTITIFERTNRRLRQLVQSPTRAVDPGPRSPTMLTVLTQNPFNLHVLTREIRRSLIPHDCRWSLARAVRALTKAKQDQPSLDINTSAALCCDA